MSVSGTERVERNTWLEGGETSPGNDGKQGFIKKLRMSTSKVIIVAETADDLMSVPLTI